MFSVLQKYANSASAAKAFACEKIGEQMFIATNAFEGKMYRGILLGVIEHENRLYAVQIIDENRLIVHDTKREDIPALEAMVGREVEITRNCDGISDISDSGSWYERLEGYKHRGR